MDTEHQTMEEKCESLMLIVVEYRKRLGKLCVEYQQKISLMENSMMKLQLNTMSKCRFKQKTTIPNDMKDVCKDIEDFSVETKERQRKIEEFKKRIKTTQNIVLQLKTDNVGKKLKQPFTAEAMLAQAKQRKLH